MKNVSLNVTKRDHNVMTAVIEGLKGGHSYSIQVGVLAHVRDSPSSSVPLAVVILPSSHFLPADFRKERRGPQSAQPPRPDNHRDQRYASSSPSSSSPRLLRAPLCTVLSLPLSLSQCSSRGFNWRRRIATSLFVAQHKKRERALLSPAWRYSALFSRCMRCRALHASGHSSFAAFNKSSHLLCLTPSPARADELLLTCSLVRSSPGQANPKTPGSGE